MKQKKLYFAIITIFFLFIPFPFINAQENNEEKAFEKFRHNQIGVLLAHTNMKQGDVNSDNKRLNLPSYTLYYNYRFNERWSLGLHTDFVTEQFVTEPINGDEKSIEREKSIAPAIMLGYKPGKHFTYLFGSGGDFDKENYFLFRFDVEYGLEIRQGWEFVTAFGYDFRINGYDSFQLGVGLSKSF